MEDVFLEEVVQLNGISSSPEPFFTCEFSKGSGQSLFISKAVCTARILVSWVTVSTSTQMGILVPLI